MNPDPVRILVVDDYLDALLAQKVRLQLLGYTVETATTCAEALELAKGGRFDLYILDAALTDGSGLRLREELRALNPLARALIHSGKDCSADELQALRGRGDDYLRKPVETAVLKDAIKRLLCSG